MFKKNKTAISLHEYAKNGNLEGIKSLVYHSNTNINQGDKNGNTPLMLAIWWNQQAIIKALLKHDNINVNIKNNNDDTALHLALKSGYPEIATQLLANGANVNEGNKNGTTPFMLTAEKGYLKLVKFLVSDCGINVNQGNKNGNTPLILALKNGNIEIVKFLVPSGAILHKKNKIGETALTLTAKNNNKEITNLMKEKIYENFEKQQLQINSETKYALTQHLWKMKINEERTTPPSLFNLSKKKTIKEFNTDFTYTNTFYLSLKQLGVKPNEDRKHEIISKNEMKINKQKLKAKNNSNWHENQVTPELNKPITQKEINATNLNWIPSVVKEINCTNNNQPTNSNQINSSNVSSII